MKLINYIKFFFVKSPQEPEISQEEALAIVHPPAPEGLTEQDHKLAQIRFVYENEISEIMFNLMRYAEYKMGISEFEDDEEEKLITDYAKDSIDTIHKAWKNEEDTEEWWEAFSTKEKLDWIKEYISSPHGGDCTAFPCACMRCHAEDYYKVPSTVTWGGKSNGYRLMKKAYNIK